MNSRQLNAIAAVMVAGLGIGLAGCDEPVEKDNAPAHVTGTVFTRHPDKSDDGTTCNVLGIKSEDGTVHTLCVSNGDYDRNPIGTVYSR